MRQHEIEHLLAHRDRLLIHIAAVDGVSLAVCVVYHGLDLPSSHGVDHVPEELFVTRPPFVELRRQVRFDLRSFCIFSIE